MNWKFVIIGLLVIAAILWIHPTSNMVRIAEVTGKMSYKLMPNDIIYEINGHKITSEADFNKVWDNINNTFSIQVKREGVPYYYVNYNYKLVKDNQSKLFVENTGNSYLKFSYEFVNHNVFNLTNKTGVITRLNKFGVSDAKIIGNQLHTRFSSGLVMNALGYQGKIVGKIGNTTVFTNSNIESYCKSPSGCIYGINEKYVNGTYQYYYQEQINLNPTAVDNIKNVVQKLPIGQCVGGICYLNESINVYLDNKQVGTIPLPADYKEKMTNRFVVYGNTSPEVSTTKFNFETFIGALATQVNTKVTYVGTHPAYKNPWMYIAIALIIPIIFGFAEFAKWRNKKYITYGILTSAEVFIALGVIALFGIIVNEVILYGLIFWSLFYSLLYLYYPLKAKGMKSKEYEMKNLDFKVHLILILASFILLIWQPVTVIPLVISSIKILITKNEFFRLNQ